MPSYAIAKQILYIFKIYFFNLNRYLETQHLERERERETTFQRLFIEMKEQQQKNNRNFSTTIDQQERDANLHKLDTMKKSVCSFVEFK